ncbi:hypothetical protein HY086_06110 [Candidatus Gottesmanbacteria bacterium]|nr:hypothetical protein [Candidatus Gottesmanbacteria bacterium]
MTSLRGDSGQVLLITLLVLSVATTIVLSVISRATTDVAISNQIAESQRAFSAAEAGIEEILQSGVAPSGAQILSPGVTYVVQKADIGGAAGVYQYPSKTPAGSGETLWLVNHNANGTLVESPTYTAATLDICWSAETTTPAVVASVLYKSGGVYKVARAAVDPDPTRAATNKFSQPTATTGGCGSTSLTTYKQTLTFANFTPAINPASDTLIWLRMSPLYAETKFAVAAPVAIPLQGSRVESSGSTTAGTTRKIVVYQQYRAPTSIFDAVVVSGGNFGR